MRVGYFGPEGTFTHEALLDAIGDQSLELVSFPTIYDTVMAVHDGAVQRALVPIENSLEGSVNATLDALAMETEKVLIAGEVVHPIRQCLIARDQLELDQVEVVVSHPQATAQCARFIRTELPEAQVMSGDSTADAVRMVAEHDGHWAALGTRAAADRYGCVVLRSGVEDVSGNETRFVWLAPGGSQAGTPSRQAGVGAGADAASAAWKTALVFWGPGSDAPGWLVSCLAELSNRGVNLTRIESRPLKQGLGSYMFFLDLEGRDSEPHVAEALEGLRGHVEVLRVLGSFPVGANSP